MQSRYLPWILASRPRTLPISFIPVLVGTLLSENPSWAISVFALLTSLCIQIGTNYINDALDFQKGADTASRVGPARVTQSGLLSAQQVLIGGYVCFILALLFGLPLIEQGGMPLAVLLVTSVLLGYFYTGGPAPIAYYGLAEFFVILFFGLANTVSVYYLQSGDVDTRAILAGLQTGSLATLVIALNNLRDKEQDARANKRTLAVRFGLSFARVEVMTLTALPFLLGLFWLGYEFYYAAILPWLTFPFAFALMKELRTASPGKACNAYFAKAGVLYTCFGILLAWGCYLK